MRRSRRAGGSSMPASSLALVILAGLIHAVWNITAKKAGGDARFAMLTGLLMALIWAPLGIWLGWNVVPTWGSVEWGLVVVSGFLHVLYYIALLRGYRKADLTVVYPLARGSGPLLSSLVAILLLGERITAFGVAGIFAVVAGVFFIAGGRGLWFRVAHDRATRAGIRMTFSLGGNTIPDAGIPGEPDCRDQTVAALATQFGGIKSAASTLEFSSVAALQNSFREFCGP